VITRLFRSRKRLDSADPSERREAIDALSDEEAVAAASELASLAVDDPDDQVRRAAVRRLTDPERLAPLLDDGKLGGLAARQVADLVQAGRAGALASHPAVLLARLADAPSPALLADVLAQNDERVLLEAAILLPREEKTRLLSQPVFQRAPLLQELERKSRDRDKATNRLARERLDALRARRARASDLVAGIGERLATLEKTPTDPSAAEARRRTALLDAVDRDLAALATLATQLAEAGEPLVAAGELDRRRAALTVSEPASPTPPPKGAESGRPPAPGGESGFDELTRAFEALEAELAGSVPFEALAQTRQSLTDRWLAHADHEPPSDAQHAVFERVSHRFQELAAAHDRLAASHLPDLDPARLPDRVTRETSMEAWQLAERLARDADRVSALAARIAWPEWAAPPAALTRLNDTLAGTRSALAAWQSAVDGYLGELAAAIGELDAHIEAGELNDARASAGEVRKRLKPLPERLSQRFQRDLARSQARLGELSDWQTFATSPKRQSLLEAMQALADAPLPPKDQAQRIKALRGEWNALGPLGRARDHRIMEQFNEAAERAFEPCRAYFAEQAEQRAKNLAERQQICDSLAAYLTATDWSHADYRAAEQIMRTARQEWRRFHPVDRTPGKPLEERFEALQSELHEHIKVEWERNLASKQAIVAEAEALADSDVTHQEKTEAAKALQHRWTSVGITPRRPDQALWRDFRAACDRIFEARDAAKKRSDERVQAGRDEASHLLAGFRQLLDERGTSLSAAEVRDFQSRFEALPALPERLQKPVAREFDELVRAARLLLKERQAAAERARLASLKDLDVEVSELEQRALAGEAVDFVPPDPLFEGRLSGTDTVPVDGLTRLVIEAEIAAGLESPESDLRIAIQVELMNSGRGRAALEADPEELTARWCRMGPKDAGVASLRDRFFGAIDRLARS
jgi:hypothetical protein